MKPYELLPGEIDSVTVDGQVVRKGTIGAFIQNALILANSVMDADTREAIETDLLELIPSMKILQVFEVFELRDRSLNQLIKSRYPDPALRKDAQ